MYKVGDTITANLGIEGGNITGTIHRAERNAYIVHLDQQQAYALGKYSADCFITIYPDEIPNIVP